MFVKYIFGCVGCDKKFIFRSKEAPGSSPEKIKDSKTPEKIYGQEKPRIPKPVTHEEFVKFEKSLPKGQKIPDLIDQIPDYEDPLWGRNVKNMLHRMLRVIREHYDIRHGTSLTQQYGKLARKRYDEKDMHGESLKDIRFTFQDFEGLLLEPDRVRAVQDVFERTNNASPFDQNNLHRIFLENTHALHDVLFGGPALPHINIGGVCGFFVVAEQMLIQGEITPHDLTNYTYDLVKMILNYSSRMDSIERWKKEMLEDEGVPEDVVQETWHNKRIDADNLIVPPDLYFAKSAQKETP